MARVATRNHPFADRASSEAGPPAVTSAIGNVVMQAAVDITAMKWGVLSCARATFAFSK